MGDSFVGVRYELLVAAAFVRAGFHVDLEDEQMVSSRLRTAMPAAFRYPTGEREA